MAVKTNNQKKTGKGKKIAIICAVVVAVLAVGALALYSHFSDSGFFLRHTVAVESDNFKVNNAMMSYFYYYNLNNAQSSSSSSS